MSKNKCSQRAFNHPVNFFFLLTTGEKRSLMSGFNMKKIIFEITEDVIAEFPRFPFTYWALSGLLSNKGDLSWKKYAEEGIQILEKTTKVAGHHANHDQKLAELQLTLEKQISR